MRGWETARHSIRAGWPSQPGHSIENGIPERERGLL